MGKAEAQSAVFVDPTGRRHRRVRRLTWTLALTAAGYVAITLASLVLPVRLDALSLPGLGRLLPGPAAPLLVDGAGVAQPPANLLTPTPTPTPTPTATATGPAGGSATNGTTGGAVAPTTPPTTSSSNPTAGTPSPTTTSAPSPTPTATPSPTPTTTAPGNSGNAPGDPSPRPTHSPTHTPTPGKPSP